MELPMNADTPSLVVIPGLTRDPFKRNALEPQMNADERR
jgi:hypothetical protein